ncbi:hypothetical protein Tco_0201202 [Tanacetum coccineum]
MDDPNITMEKYIRLEEEKARRHGRTFNWQTATFGKVKNYKDEDDCFIDFETKFPAIVFDNTTLPSDPTIISVNDLKTDSGNDNDNIPLSPNPTIDYFDDLDFFKDFENEFPAIVYNDAQKYKSDYLTEPILNLKHIDEFNLNDETSLSEYDKENVLRFNDLFNIIRPDDLKSEKDNDDNDIDIIQYSEGNETTPRENVLSETSHDKIIKTFRRGSFVINLKVNIVIWNCYVNGMLFFLIINLYVLFVIPFDPKRYYKDGSHTKIAEAKIWHHYPLLIRDTLGSDTRLRDTLRVLYVDLAVRLRMVYTGEGQHVFVSHAWRRLFGILAPLVREFILEFLSTCRMSDTEMGLDVADTLCFQLGEAGFGAYWNGSDRLIPDRGDLWDYWIEISSDRDFLGPAPSYAPEKVTGVDLFYLHIIDRGTTNVSHLLARYLFRHAEGRKSGARLSRGHFIGRLAMHFGLVSDEGLRGLQGPERQQGAAAGAHKADEAGPTAEEGAQEILTLAQVPPPPPPAPQPRTMSQRIKRIEEEVHDLRRDVVGLRGVVKSFTTVLETQKVSVTSKL